jgi:hypothetical protein
MASTQKVTTTPLANYYLISHEDGVSEERATEDGGGLIGRGYLFTLVAKGNFIVIK